MSSIYLNDTMQIRDFTGQGTWWVRELELSPDFTLLWDTVCKRFAHLPAYFQADHQPVSYHQLNQQIQALQPKIAPGTLVKIDGSQTDWLIQAIAAWYAHSVVVFFDPGWKTQDPKRLAALTDVPVALDFSQKNHLITMTSGTTNQPKMVVRSTLLALFEAASYLEDLSDIDLEIAVSLIRPWFGAMTKHTLGMLLAGVPQYFATATPMITNQRSIIYGTPSQIISYPQSSGQWNIISLTGEPINANHVRHFHQSLKPNGYVLDSLGCSECGVIARRKVTMSSLYTLCEGFSGEVLPGKAVTIDPNGLLSVQALGGAVIETGDLASIENSLLYLRGRCSTKRKVRGLWLDVEPMLALLRTRPEINHLELANYQTETDQLVVFLDASKELSANALQNWLLSKLLNIKLIPHFEIFHERAVLGPSGKRTLSSKKIKHTKGFHAMLQTVIDSIIDLDRSLRRSFIDQSLETQGFDSIDMVTLRLEMQRRLGGLSTISTMLKTDTPRAIAALLGDSQTVKSLRIIAAGPHLKTILCIGSGITCIQDHLSKIARLSYTDIIYSQQRLFTMQEIAQNFYTTHASSLIEGLPLYIAAYSINTLFAIELAYILEKNNIKINGLFLLDPPSAKRHGYLKRKRWWLHLRYWVLVGMIRLGIYSDYDRVHYELRKIAIARQPKRSIQAKTWVLRCLGQPMNSPWLLPSPQHDHIEIDCIHHLDLVSTQQGISSWLEFATKFFSG